MIFAHDELKAILSGRKTSTRRQWKKCRFEQGKSYAIHLAQRPASHWITILNPPRQERLGDLSIQDAKREGFRSRQEFQDHWKAKHRAYNPDEIVFVLDFVLGDFEDHTRIPAGRAGVHGHYVSSASQSLRGTDSEVSESVQKRFAKENHVRHQLLRKQSLRTELETVRSEGGSNKELRQVQRKARRIGPLVYDPGERTA
jgi:hypothetical protein